MENMSPGTLASSRETSVDLPDPDGAEMMNTVVMYLKPPMNADKRR
jgi:hypothetical protein